MGFGQAVSSGFRNYATFSGRARRSEFWWWVLFTAIVSVVAQVLDLVLGLRIGGSSATVDAVNNSTFSFSFSSFGWITLVASLVLLLPSLAMQVRRLHDADHTGWWWWINVICCIGWIILLVFWLQPSTPGANRYGPQPV